MIGWGLAAALFATVGFSRVTLHTPWRQALQAFAIACLFTVCIMPLAVVTMRRLAPAVMRRYAFPVDWVILIAAMIVVGMVGSVICIGILAASGLIVPGHAIRTWLSGSLKVSVIMTLTFGISITAREALRGKLASTTLALRTKERDEAEARRLATEAQLASLEARVNPHFLYNTLNSIAELIHENPAGAERMTTQLAALMRSSLEGAPAGLVTLDEELTLVRHYLDIEGVRFGPRLRYTIDVPDALGAMLVPRLSIQTLVENSIKYAVSARREGAVVTIRATAINGRLRLEVTDDGPGFDAASASEGHGLALLRSRLAITYGERAGLTIDSGPGGTTVSMDLPRA